MPPTLQDIDHIHVLVGDRGAAEKWYAQVLGLQRVVELESWATGGGPLTIGNAAGTIHLALFERVPEASRSTIALSASGAEFVAWKLHLSEVLGRQIGVEDHQLSWSLYFKDPDGNPYEITSYEYSAIASVLVNQAPNPSIEATS